MKLLRILLLCLAAGIAAGLAAGMLALLSSTARAAAAASQLDARHAAPDQPQDWLFECVDCPPQFTESSDRMLRLDMDGNPHLAYGRDHLYYSTFDGNAWQTEIADPAPFVGTRASLDLYNNNPYISYYDSLNSALKFAYRDGSGWHAQTLDDAAGDGGTSLALDDAGYAHISYWDGSANKLKYAYQDALGWHFEIVDTASFTGRYSSLALDAQGDARIAYGDLLNSRVKYATRQGGTWNSETAASGGNYGKHISLALDAQGDPHISLFDDQPGYDLRYTFRSTGVWIDEQTVDSEVNVGLYSSIAIISQTIPVISYWADNTTRYAVLAEGGWVTATVDSNGAVGVYTSLAADANGQPHIAYYETTQGLSGYKLKYARMTSGSWQTEFVNTALDVGMFTSLALDANGFAHISYLDNTWRDLKYAYQDGSGWHGETVDWAGDIGLYSSLALDMGGFPHIAYFDFSNSNLKYARKRASGWEVQTVDQAGDVGRYLSLALDQDDYAHISYYDGTGRNLKYAYLDGSGWHTQTVDMTGTVGLFTSLALDSGDLPHITYFEDDHDQLRFASLQAGEWVTETVGAARLAMDTSLALDADGDPAVAFYDIANGDLRFASRQGITWTLETVDGYGDAGANPSLALDADGVAHISYTGDLCPGPCGHLKYALRGPSGWISQTLDASSINTGAFSSLELTSAGEPRISYYDALLGDLKLAATPVGLSGLVIEGPSNGIISQAYTFTVNVSPVNATLPITYSLLTTEQVAQQFAWSGNSISWNNVWTIPGFKLITVTAENADNQVSGTHAITITDIPVASLTAANDGPTRLGETTTLSATLQSGSGVSFSWDFGDAQGGSGALVAHTYAAAGMYTATVSASNTAGTWQATTLVRINTGGVFLPVVLNRRE